jgi:hypothetical protein
MKPRTMKFELTPNNPTNTILTDSHGRPLYKIETRLKSFMTTTLSRVTVDCTLNELKVATKTKAHSSLAGYHFLGDAMIDRDPLEEIGQIKWRVVSSTVLRLRDDEKLVSDFLPWKGFLAR